QAAGHSAEKAHDAIDSTPHRRRRDGVDGARQEPAEPGPRRQLVALRELNPDDAALAPRDAASSDRRIEEDKPWDAHVETSSPFAVIRTSAGETPCGPRREIGAGTGGDRLFGDSPGPRPRAEPQCGPPAGAHGEARLAEVSARSSARRWPAGPVRDGRGPVKA